MDDDDRELDRKTKIGEAAAGEYAYNDILSVLDKRKSATIGDLSFEGETYAVIVKPTKNGNLNIDLKPSGGKPFAIARSQNHAKLKDVLGALQCAVEDGATITLREDALGRAVKGKQDPEVAMQEIARQMFKVETEEQRAALIDRIVDDTPSRFDGYSVGRAIERKGTDGKWYPERMMPRGMQSVDSRVIAYNWIKNGVTANSRFETELDAENGLAKARQKERDESRQELEERTPQQLFEAAAWRLRHRVIARLYHATRYKGQTYTIGEQTKTVRGNRTKLIADDGSEFWVDTESLDTHDHGRALDSSVDPALFDAVADGEFFALIAEGAAILDRLDEGSPTFCADLRRGREILELIDDNHPSDSNDHDDAELDRRGGVVADYVDQVNSRKGAATRLSIGPIGANAAARIKAATGFDVDGSTEVVIASNVLHASERHPDLTREDWLLLPRLTNRFDEAAIGRDEGDKTMPRVVIRRMDGDIGYGTVLAHASGANKGKRLKVL